MIKNCFHYYNSIRLYVDTSQLIPQNSLFQNLKFIKSYFHTNSSFLINKNMPASKKKTIKRKVNQMEY
jgi:hypothetical protein